jgi:hypothetical protein
MRPHDLRIPMLAGAATVLLAFSPANAATLNDEVIFVPGTGDSTVVVQREEAPLPVALAEDRAGTSDTQAEMMAMSDKMADPRMQDGVANMVGNMTEKIMDFPIGRFAVAMERAIPGGLRGNHGKHIHADDTVADLAGRDADRLPSELAKGSRQMMGMMSGFAAAFADIIPEFEKLGDEMAKSVDDIKHAKQSRY